MLCLPALANSLAESSLVSFAWLGRLPSQNIKFRRVQCPRSIFFRPGLIRKPKDEPRISRMINGFHSRRALWTHPAGLISKLLFIRALRVIRGCNFGSRAKWFRLNRSFLRSWDGTEPSLTTDGHELTRIFCCPDRSPAGCVAGFLQRLGIRVHRCPSVVELRFLGLIRLRLCVEISVFCFVSCPECAFEF